MRVFGSWKAKMQLLFLVSLEAPVNEAQENVPSTLAKKQQQKSGIFLAIFTCWGVIRVGNNVDVDVDGVLDAGR